MIFLRCDLARWSSSKMFLSCGLFSALDWRSFTFLCSSFSSSRYFFAFRLEYLIVKPLISIFMRSHFKPKSWVSLYFSLKLGMLILSAVTYASSLRKAVLNFQKPGPLFWFRWLDCRTSETAEWSDSGAWMMSHFFANWINSCETKNKSKRHWILNDLVLLVKHCLSLLRIRHISLRLYKSQSVLISWMKLPF